MVAAAVAGMGTFHTAADHITAVSGAALHTQGRVGRKAGVLAKARSWF